MTPTTRLSEFELLPLLRANDRNAYDYLYRNYYTSFFRIVYSIIGDVTISKDVVHDGFIKVYKAVHTHDPSKGSLISYLRVLMKYCALDQLKRMKRRAIVEKAGSIYLESIDDPLAGKLNCMGVAKAVNNLQDNYRSLILKRYFQGYLFEEIRQEQGVAENAVHYWHNAALQQMKDLLAGKKIKRRKEIYTDSKLHSSYVLNFNRNTMFEGAVPEEYNPGLSWPEKCLYILDKWGEMYQRDIYKKLLWLDLALNEQEAKEGVRVGLELLKKANRLKIVSAANNRSIKVAIRT